MKKISLIISITLNVILLITIITLASFKFQKKGKPYDNLEKLYGNLLEISKDDGMYVTDHNLNFYLPKYKSVESIKNKLIKVLGHTPKGKLYFNNHYLHSADK